MSTLETRPWIRTEVVLVAGLLAVQFVAAAIIGTQGLLVRGPGDLIPPIGMSAAIPVALFLLAYATSARVRVFVLSRDIVHLTGLHLWRVVGFTFLAVYAFGHLPAVFAFPAGLGDVAVGVAAALFAARLARDSDYATAPGLVRFHLLGLLDFAVAITAGSLAVSAGPSPIELWPLNLFPSFLVPAFVIAHLMALLKIRALRRSPQHQDAVGGLHALG